MSNKDDNTNLIVGSLVVGGLVGLGLYYFSDAKNKKWVKKELQNYYDQGEEIFEQAKGKFAKVSKGSSLNGMNMAIGSIAGAVIGVAAVHLLTQNPKKAAPLLRDVTNKAEKWMNTAKGILENVDESLNHEEEEEDNRSTLDNVLHLASVGFKIYNNIRERR